MSVNHSARDFGQESSMRSQSHYLGPHTARVSFPEYVHGFSENSLCNPRATRSRWQRTRRHLQSQAVPSQAGDPWLTQTFHWPVRRNVKVHVRVTWATDAAARSRRRRANAAWLWLRTEPRAASDGLCHGWDEALGSRRLIQFCNCHSLE